MRVRPLPSRRLLLNRHRAAPRVTHGCRTSPEERSDVSVKYQVNLGLSPLPNSDFDAPAISVAKVGTSDIAKFPRSP